MEHFSVLKDDNRVRLRPTQKKIAHITFEPNNLSLYSEYKIYFFIYCVTYIFVYREMFKTVFLAIIVGATVWSTQANNSKESECIEELERELQAYVKLDGWQKLFTRHFKFIVNENGEVLSERKRLKFNTIIHNVCYTCY